MPSARIPLLIGFTLLLSSSVTVGRAQPFVEKQQDLKAIHASLGRGSLIDLEKMLRGDNKLAQWDKTRALLPNKVTALAAGVAKRPLDLRASHDQQRLTATVEWLKSGGFALDSRYLFENSKEIASRRGLALAFIETRTPKNPADELLRSLDVDTVERIVEISTGLEMMADLTKAGRYAEALVKHVTVDGAISDWLTWLEVTAQVDELDFAHRRLLSATTLDSLAALDSLVVEVHIIPPNKKKWSHVGTGFWVKGHIVTCAHVVTTSTFDAKTKTVKWDRVSIRTLGEDPVRFQVDAAEARVFPRFDVAAFKVRAKPEDAAKLTAMHTRLRELSERSLGYAFEDVDLSIGVVYGLGTLRGKKESVFIPPGRILFPHVIKKPVNMRKTRGSNAAFRRALRAQLWGLLGRFRGTDPKKLWELVEAATSRLMKPPGALEAGYDRCTPNRLCRLRYPTPDSNHLADMAGKDELRIECFGTDLVTSPSTSGSPIFMLREGRQVVIGIHSGRIGSDASSSEKRPTLKHFERALPFQLAWAEALKPFLDEDR